MQGIQDLPLVRVPPLASGEILLHVLATELLLVVASALGPHPQRALLGVVLVEVELRGVLNPSSCAGIALPRVMLGKTVLLFLRATSPQSKIERGP